jgi:extracellular factor (EF) 3-hydroxypalmitic acid methyl ester biosynthesis protein
VTVIGVVALPGADKGGLLTARSQRFRALRHPTSEFGLGPISASFYHPRLHAKSAECENLSLHGLLLRLPGAAGSAPLLALDDRLTGLHVVLVTGEVVYHGDAVVRQVRTDQDVEKDDLLLGVLLPQGVVDLTLLHEQQARGRFSVRCNEVERTADGARILPQVKEWIADLRFYLESVQGFLDQEEAALCGEDQYTCERVRDEYLKEIGPRVVRRVHQASHSMEQLLGGLTEEEHAAHRTYVQHHLGALFQTSPLMRRALRKPLGYAGDYEMMNMLYRKAEEGSSLFGQIMNRCAVEEVAAQAIVNRLSYLGDKVRCAIDNRTGPRARLCSIGSGPAREIDALLTDSPELGAMVDVMLVDQDARAISYCERKLGPLARSTSARLHLVRESIRRLLTGGSLAHTLGQRDLIYSAGLFDYLSERSFAALLSALYEALVPGGMLVIGNVSLNNPTRYFMEYFLEWFLVHRSPTQLREQARILRPTPKAVRVESEPLGVNLFLVIER